MVEINAYKDGKGNVVITEDSFEMLLACLDNQKFVGEAPQNGDSIAAGEEVYGSTQVTIQKTIDIYNRTCRDILHSHLTTATDTNGFNLYKRYENQVINLEWTNSEIDHIVELLSHKTNDRFMRADDKRILVFHQPKHSIRTWSDDEMDVINEYLKNKE